MIDTTPLTPHERIIKSKISLNDSHPFFSYILMYMDIEQSKANDGIPTMAVNKKGRLLWNETFTAKLSDSELEAVLAHESMHMALQSFYRQDTRDHGLWNIATDLAINALLKNEGIHLPDGCIIPDSDDKWEFKGKDGKVVIENVLKKSAEEIYDVLSSHAEKVYQDYKIDSDGNYEGSIDQHQDGGEEGEDGEDVTESNADENANKEKWKRYATEAMTQHKMRGKSSSHLERLIDGVLNPEVDWRSKLSQFITKELPVDFTMRAPGRRFYTTGVYYPSIIREKLNVIVAIDTSVSISDNEYKKFLGECLGIARAWDQVEMRILWWSTEVTDDQQVTSANADSLINYEFGSTGGTTMSCVADYCEENNITNNLYIYLTDGHVEEDPNLPEGHKLFVISKGGTSERVKDKGICVHLNR